MVAGQVRRIDARIATEMLLGMLRGANRYRRKHDTLEDLVAAVTGVFLYGVGTETERRLATSSRPDLAVRGGPSGSGPADRTPGGASSVSGDSE